MTALRSHAPWRRYVWRVAWTLAAGGVIAAALAVVLAGVIWIWWLREPGDEQRSSGVNALWAAHTWVGDPHTDDEYQAFAALLTRNEISDLFAHAGPLEADGSVPDDLVVYAPAFLDAMNRYAPGVRVQAYLGQIEAREGGILDINDPAARDGIIATAGHMLDMGFQGIHYDIEPIYPGDDRFLELLDRTAALTRPRGAKLSVALEQMEVAPGSRSLISFLDDGYHDPGRGYLRKVAERADQIAIMTYDTGLPANWLFGAFVAWQTEHVAKTVGPGVTVFIGVPTYDSGTFGRFHPWAENMSSGIRGVRKGTGHLSTERRAHVGIAIFAEWTTTDDEWATYARDWLRK